MGKNVSVIGVGKVGSAAISYLVKKGATVYVADIEATKIDRLKKIHKELV